MRGPHKVSPPPLTRSRSWSDNGHASNNPCMATHVGFWPIDVAAPIVQVSPRGHADQFCSVGVPRTHSDVKLTCAKRVAMV